MLALGSCKKDFLDQKNPNQVTTALFWKTEADLKAALATTYWAATYNAALYGDYGYYYGDARTENYVSPPGDVILDYNNTPSDGGPHFAADYRGINYCNQIIQYGGAMAIDAGIKQKYIPEAYFMRGIFYLGLVNDYGSVPIHTTVAEKPEDYNIERSPIQEVWNQVVSDFAKAAEGLPAVRPSSETGRATKGAALAFLGRAYLYQGKWAEAQAALKSIVDHEGDFGYGLQPKFTELFDGAHENGPESVFAKQVSYLGGTDIFGSIYTERPLTSILGQIYAPAKIGGWELILATPNLLNAYLEEPALGGGFDDRSHATIAWDYPGNVFYTHDFHSYFDVNKIYNKKYGNWWDTNEGEMRSKLDWYAMRYSDVLLMLAEAYTMQGNVTAAAPLVQRVRTRAKLQDKTVLFLAYSQSQMMTEIRHQRNLEFAWEHLHFYDLRRWGLLADAISKGYSPYKSRWSSKLEYFPIPQAELNTNPNITQNDAWK